jgi:hypothetical protein
MKFNTNHFLFFKFIQNLKVFFSASVYIIIQNLQFSERERTREKYITDTDTTNPKPCHLLGVSIDLNLDL